jgi:hypothetical protein
MLTRPHPFQHRTKSIATQAGFWFLVSVLVLLLTACGGGSDPAPTPTPAPIPTATITGATSDTATQPGDVAHDGTTDDTTPTLQGTLSAALTGTQRVYVYNGDSRLTEQATVTGTQWVFTPAAPLVVGTHRFTAEVADGAGVASARSAAYVVKMVAAAKLPDTGITAAQCYAAGSNALVSCTSAAAMALNDQQDGMVGRDVSNPSNTDGKLGFSYSTVGSYSKEECVKDNITGLTWEGKPTSGLRAAGNTYTNYDSTTATQIWDEWDESSDKPTQAQIDAATNTVGYVAAVNAAKLCGYSDWRLPSADELQGLVDYSVAYPGPAIDSTWFPNTQSNYYWTHTPDVGDAIGAWMVQFQSGGPYGYFRSAGLHIRLVR